MILLPCAGLGADGAGGLLARLVPGLRAVSGDPARQFPGANGDGDEPPPCAAVVR
ncbi:hypothetical protein ABR738_12110 [Streptomyces sp. Edi4]|uniref:hypothetical protein n=1 Tax=Streptomyces sp. Edi4 TaxID=3162527 RepID=UPI0033064C9F